MPRANKWFESRPEMLIFLDHLRIAQWSTAFFFLHFSDIDTLVSEDCVPFIIFRKMMFIFNITYHVPFIHHFPPFTIHIGNVILPNGFRFKGGVKIHDIIQTIYKIFKACIDSIFVVKVERFQQMI